MYLGVRDKDTICAVSTPNGIGGISVIRISGIDALKIVQKSIKNPPKVVESHRVFLANFINSLSLVLIDEVCITVFLDGKSFTGEEVVEISCHGSPTICQLILDQLCFHGARVADRGEFTYRAFLNSRLDLIQAESVLSAIHSKSELSAKLALRQLKGDLSSAIKKVEDEILWCLAHIEASIDFSSEDIEIIQDHTLLNKLDIIETNITELVHSFKFGKMISDGVQITLSGKPNTGKSSLMNLLLQTNRSIITDVAGTTRDVIKEDFLYEGIRFILVDTAGIRNNTDDIIEKMGIERTFREQDEAQVNMFIFDFSDCFGHPAQERNKSFNQESFSLFSKFDLNSTFLILNKIDLSLNPQQTEFLRNYWQKISKFASKEEFFSDFRQQISEPCLFQFIVSLFNYLELQFNFKTYQDLISWISVHVIFCSTFDLSSRKYILNAVMQSWVDLSSHIDNASVTSSRQKDALVKSLHFIESTKLAVGNGLGHEFIALDLKEALLSIQSILGIVYDDQILDKVFKEFCLGK